MNSVLRSRQIRDSDHLLVAAVAGIVFLGILTLRTIPGAGAQRQLLYAAVGILVFLVAASVDYGFLRNAWQAIYWGMLAALVVVLVLGKTVFGAKQWVVIGGLQLQPSEFAKVVLIASLAVFAADNRERMHEVLEFARSFVEVTLPILVLVMLQGDLGTTLVLLAIWLGIAYFSGANIWHIGLFLLILFILADIAWQHGLVKAYQEQRVMAWLHPHRYLDSSENKPMAGLQYLMSWRAIGAGGVWGQGYGKGSLTQFGMVPAQETDMTFSALAEEMGFFASCALVVLYGIVVWRGLDTVLKTQHELGRYLAAGAVSYIAFEVIVNVGMNVGLLPITGIPLPLFSRGGSNLIATMAALGLLVNVHLRRRRITFYGT
jgi:rod shape determining protein RodA